MFPVSAVLLYSSLHDVISLLCSWFLNNATFLITFLSLKSHKLLWIKRARCLTCWLSYAEETFKVLAALRVRRWFATRIVKLERLDRSRRTGEPSVWSLGTLRRLKRPIEGAEPLFVPLQSRFESILVQAIGWYRLLATCSKSHSLATRLNSLLKDCGPLSLSTCTLHLLNYNLGGRTTKDINLKPTIVRFDKIRYCNPFQSNMHALTNNHERSVTGLITSDSLCLCGLALLHGWQRLSQSQCPMS